MAQLVKEGFERLHGPLLCDCYQGRQLSILFVGRGVYLGRCRVNRSGQSQSLFGLRRYTFTTC
mgnify:FL=1